ncbi:MAG: succinyl-diaminopimelate desuccinylase [Proteobacteria bacterium]|nr:succinyl-diaminopimelate desuccinylase [Pseudomonadota bacterium]
MLNKQMDDFQAYTIDLLQQLLRFESITPQDAGIMRFIKEELEKLGFICTILEFSEKGEKPVLNLYARYGMQEPNLCFAGHLDVVPPGERAAWKYPPFAGHLQDGTIYGRGAVDMKGAVASFIGAAKGLINDNKFKGSLSILLTGDEEGDAINGTNKVLGWLEGREEKLDACIVGEPTAEVFAGDTIKVGRRGSANFKLIIEGTQGHVAYPEKANNPVHHLVSILQALQSTKLDDGTKFFTPSQLQITTIDVGNPTSNIIPDKAAASFNIRFNELHTAAQINNWVSSICDKQNCHYTLNISCNSHPFISAPGKLCETAIEVCREVLLREPILSTSGGTSDARFIHRYCETIELGLCNAMAHKVDECVEMDSIFTLILLYNQIMRKYFQLPTT